MVVCLLVLVYIKRWEGGFGAHLAPRPPLNPQRNNTAESEKDYDCSTSGVGCMTLVGYQMCWLAEE